MKEVGFVDHFVESDTKPIEQLEVVVEDIPNLFYFGIDISFHDHLVGFGMEIAKHLVMDDPVTIGSDL